MKGLLLGVFFFTLALSSSLFADFELCLTTNGSCSGSIGDYVVIGSNGTVVASHGVSGGTPFAAPGVTGYNGAVGSYDINLTLGLVSPNTTLDIMSTNVALASAGALDILFSENSIGPTYSGWNMTFRGSLTSTGSGATVTNKAYESNGNAFFATTNTIGKLGPDSPGSFNSFTTGLVSGVTTHYSLTDEIALIGAGTTVLNITEAQLAPVPEPLGILLFGTVLVMCASKLRKRLKAQS